MVPMPTDTVKVGDGKVEVRGLSRAEYVHLNTYADDPEAAEAFVLACGTGLSEEEAAAWLAATPTVAAGHVLDRIAELSGEDEGKDGPGDGPSPTVTP